MSSVNPYYFILIPLVILDYVQNKGGSEMGITELQVSTPFARP